MEFFMDRKYRKPGHTISNLYIDGWWFCNVPLMTSMSRDVIMQIKILGNTAIPAGRYRVELKIRSRKLSSNPAYAWCKGFLPRLMNVPGFAGVLIHAGNKASDSRGCLLVGFNTSPAQLTSSMSTLKCLYKTMVRAKEEIWLTIDSTEQSKGRAIRGNCTMLNFGH